MKVVSHIPTEQYGFVELHHDTTNAHEVAHEYKEFQDAFKSGQGIPVKDFDAFVERQLLGEHNELETYLQMSDEQKQIVQVNKRALKRISAKLEQV
jgi:hypothetical protein